MNRSTITVGAVVLAAPFSASPAFAQTAAQDGYSQPAGSVQQQLGSARDEPHSKTVALTNRDRSLPFTGLDLGLVGAAGSVLLALGLATRRLGRRDVS
jgi:hypothetical protein